MLSIGCGTMVLSKMNMDVITPTKNSQHMNPNNEVNLNAPILRGKEKGNSINRV